MSSGTRNLVRLAAVWMATIAIGAVGFVYMSAIRDTLGQAPVPDVRSAAAAVDEPVPPSSNGRVEIHASRNGHFHTTAHINGRPVEVMVDTGATMVALTWDDARQAGIVLGDSEFKHKVSTANGTARMAAVMLDSVSIADVTVRNVRAAVAEPGKLQTTLLGMTFLGKLGRAEMSRGTLILEQ